jgi:redox-sensitive bicupin YhaK (pirin superfamily)
MRVALPRGGGFPTQGHRDMEIITYVLDGVLEHRDSLGNGVVIGPGDVQRMSAGRGVRHSEFNHSPTEPLDFIQICLLPNREGIDPSYAQQFFPPEALGGRLCLLVSPDGRDGSLMAHQDHPRTSKRRGWRARAPTPTRQPSHKPPPRWRHRGHNEPTLPKP